ncbi:MAG: EAL domain-containing protein [Zhaonellaceae bacterium]
MEAMCQESPEQAPFALMILDIDSFNYINYALGYSLSDQLIIEVAKRLNSHFGEEELVFHFSGDQFALIVQSLSKLEEYREFAQKVIQLLSQPFKVDNYELHITVSIGISIYPRDGKDWEQLIKYAHIALLRAKNEGKNKYKFYSPDIDIHSYKQFELHNDLPKAIENGELNLYYQPIVNLKNNQILGAEALVSWEHPSWGTVAARQFTALAEETGLIVTIGKWLLREVCKTYKQWLKDKLPKIKVSISISKSQFFEKDFVENVKGIIAEFGLEPDFLIMEISGKNLPETDKIASDLQKLQALGIEIALVEFGTTCLASLNSLKIDYLKINRAISKNILTDPTHAVTTKYLIKTAQELEIKFIAAGIETSEQLAYLRRLKCLLGQGAIYSRPLPAKDFEKILNKKKCKPQAYVRDEKADYEEKREFFRINFHSLLEGEMTILKLKGKNVNVGNTKVLIKDIGPGGLCFISNIKLPVEKYLILQFTTQLLDTEIKVTGYPVWLKEMDDDLYKYGIEYVIDENERIDLVKIFNQVQIKMKHDILFAEGSFVSSSPAAYFNSLNRKCI